MNIIGNNIFYKKHIVAFIVMMILLVLMSLSSCTNQKGYEFMPNMYRSPSLETYGENVSWGTTARMPVEGTIPIGYVPFEYDGTLEGYLSAGRELKNPISFTDDNMQEGKELYGMFCKHCHGTNGDGKGTVKHAVYSAIPAYNDNKMIRRTGGTMNELKEGHIYHTITYGLNAMGPHASQISSEERWKIVHYIKEELQKEE